MKWKTKDGRVIPIAEIQTDHLLNIISMLRRKGGVTIEEYVDCLAYVCSKNTPDGAQMCAESELQRMIPLASLKVLEDELARRKTQ